MPNPKYLASNFKTISLSAKTFFSKYTSQEPHSISSPHFVEDRLHRLVRHAIEKDEITMSRGAEIFKMDFEAMRDVVSSWI